ncbi:MAG: hypothetical protein DWQ01_20045 [Planctomycetota bacterium]|nr:MAG: hypothetical protein DWQ01_20045 [Planctomycetota bacterium]
MNPTRQDQRAACPGGDFSSRPPLQSSPVTEANDLEQLFQRGLPAFGGAYLRRVWQLLDQAIGAGYPMTLAISGPVTASAQHWAWLNPLLDTGWFALVSTTDAVCYHDGHRSLAGTGQEDFREVPIFGDDGQWREEEIIRITDVGFPEQVLLDQDRELRRILGLPEFQRRMTGTEMRFLLGSHFAQTEREKGVPEGFLALCHRKAIPVFVGAPGDGSVFLNSMRLWAEAKLQNRPFAFELDLHQEVFESCAYHYWGLKQNPKGAMGTLILGGGVPKNFNLQPEPALGQVLEMEDIRGYLFDIQITTAPVTDGSLSSCPPAEAVTWGKVDKDHYRQTTESLSADYSMVMPFITKALLQKRERLHSLEQEIGREALQQRHPEAAGYLRDPAGFRLFAQRLELVEALFQALKRSRHA